MRSGFVTTTIAATIIMVAVLGMASTDVIALETSILPASSFETSASADSGDTVLCSWHSSGDVRLTIRAPGGAVVVDKYGVNGFETYEVDQSGTYHFDWENLEAAVISLEYSIDVLPFSGLDDFWDMAKWMVWGIIIGTIVFIVVLVVLIYALVRGDRSRTPQGYVPPATYPYYGAQTYPYAQRHQPPGSAAICPGCGVAVTGDAMFCQKCGKRLK